MNLVYGLRLFVFCLCITFTLTAKTTTRAAIDIGSGGPKLRIAEIDLDANRILTILHQGLYPIHFQECLSKSEDKTLSTEILLQGVNAIQEAIALAQYYDVEGIVIIGAAVFRNAMNGELFAQKISSQTGMEVHILDQELEGKLAFEAALDKENKNRDNVVIWDIGGGSTQFVGTDLESNPIIYGSSNGAGPFKDFIIEFIQCRNIKECRSPNPISQDHANRAVVYASSLAAKVDPVFKEKLQKETTEVVGVGSVFGRGIAALMPGKNPFTLEDLTAKVQELIGKSDDDLGGHYARVEVSNALLVLGFMLGLDIKKMSIVDVNNADGAILYAAFWEEKSSLYSLK